MFNTDKPLYFPLAKGRYEVKPGLFHFPHDFGNQQLDHQVFQLDGEFCRYHSEKLAARAERLNKYYHCQEFNSAVKKTINQFIAQRLALEHPQTFQLEEKGKNIILHCQHSQEKLIFDHQYSLQGIHGKQPVSPAYQGSFDALACQVQEDLAVVEIDTSGQDKLTGLHLCFPNHWAAEDKIGQNFISVHAPVPGMDKVNQNISQLLDAILNKGPFVRFAWGVATDTRLNHHPEPALETKRRTWQGRRFNPDNPELYLRIERQTLHGFPAQQCILFTIRTYFLDINQLKSDKQKISSLIAALSTMKQESQSYKGLSKDYPAILDWLESIRSLD